MNKNSRLTHALIGLALTTGCHRDNPPGDVTAPFEKTPPAVEGSKTYLLKGVVRKVNPNSGEVTIAHEEIPGFMPAMVMPFTLKDKSALEDVQPGDEVEGPFVVRFKAGEVEGSDLMALAVTRPALSPMAEPVTPPEPLKLGEPVPDFTVTTQDGQRLRLSELKGEVVALTFIYTRCPLPNFCPAIDLKFASLARRISIVPARAARVRLLSVSFDPEHDRPETLRTHAKLRGAKPPLWTFAVASNEELRKISGPLGLNFSPVPGAIEHNLRTAVIAPDGTLSRLEAGSDWDPTDLLNTLYSLIPASEK